MATGNFKLRDPNRKYRPDDKCDLCEWLGGGHDVACPEVAENKQGALADFNTGYGDSRYNGVEEPKYPRCAAYDLGFQKGEVALEEHDNGDLRD